jgi:DNA-binding transcriptional LysR family regulator
MNLDQLETFLYVARTRSFSRAAVLLDLAQPTLSGRIGALEGELGVRLFIRRGHTLDLSESGQALLPYAERMLALRAEGRMAVQRMADGGLGRLSLGANPSCSQYLVPRLIERFLAAHTGVPLGVRTATSPILMENLLDGVIQLAICSRAQLHINAEVLWSYSDELALVASPEHPLARAKACTRADIARHTVLSTQAGPTRLGLRHLLPPGSDHAVAVEATAGEVLTQLLVRGIGVSVLPAMAIWHELATGKLLRIPVVDASLPPYEVALAVWGGRSQLPAARAFTTMVSHVDVKRLLDD